MSHLDNSGSEDGQLRSPGVGAGGDELILSESEEGDTADSLDIKPPQATKRDSGRRKSGKERKHSKEHKHKSSSHDDREYYVSREYQKKRVEEERRHRHGAAYIPGGRGDTSARDRERERHVHRREYYEQQQRQQHEYHSRHTKRERDKRLERNIYERERRKYADHTQYENRMDAQKALEEDLRSRLLSKRHKYDKEGGRYEDVPSHYDSSASKSNQQQPEYRKDHKNRRDNIIEVIDSPEHYSDYFTSKKKEKKIIDDPELQARRAKLLEAEREMARRKEVAREELEVRRMKRGRREEMSSEQSLKLEVKKRHAEEHKSHRKKMKQSPREEGEYDDKMHIHEISDNSEDSTEEEEEDDDDDEDKSDDDSDEKSEGSYSDTSKHSKSKIRRSPEDDPLPDSPLSVGKLSKSDHRRSISQSRSRSHSLQRRSHSHSPEDTNSPHDSRSSKSKSRSRSQSYSERSGSKSPTRSRSRSKSKTRSESGNRSKSLPISISRSRSRSKTRSRSNSPNEKDNNSKEDKRRKENAEKSGKLNNDEDVEMIEKVNTEEKDEKLQASESADSSPRDEKGEKLPNYFPGIQGCRSVEEFQCLNRIEEGTYGVVYRAKDKRTNEIVALKRLKMEKEKEGFPITSLREINTLLKGQHPNIVTVREIVVGSNMDKIFIVMDYVEHDLKSLMETMKHKQQSFFPGEVKCLLQQLLRAIAHLHDNWILHRDLKTSNLLLSHKGILKVGDFGLAREYGSPLRAYTSVVVTLWYRAPELLLGSKEYSTPIDMWSVGCIFAEFLQMAPLFPGKSDMGQLNIIFKELGTPNERIWPGYKELPAVQNILSQNSHFTEYPVSNLRRRFFNKTSDLGISLLQGLLTYDPKQRLTADQALKSPYFKELPLPIDPSMFPTWPAKSELGARKALASSPKPPSGGSQFKQLGRDEFTAATMANKSTGFVLNAGIDQRQLAMGPGFSLKF